MTVKRLLMAAAGAALLASAAQPLLAQQATGEDSAVDRIVAIVGSTPILLSEVDEQIFARLQAQQQTPPTDPVQVRALRRDMLQQLVDLELIYQIALTDTTVKVTDEQVDAAVDEQVRNIRRQFRSDEEYRTQLRETGFLTPEEYRRWLTETQRKELIRNRMIEQLRGTGKLKPVIPTDRELRVAFEEERGRRKRPQSVSFRQIVVAPTARDSAKARAFGLADSIATELRKGGDFATAARRFSMDEASKEQGGSLGWFRRGVMDQRFEDVAFALRPGTISPPIETPFGYHLIQVERVQPAEVSARHILIMPEITQADADSARLRAESVRAALAAGASFDSLARQYHDPLEDREVPGLPVDRLLPVYAQAFEGVEEGGLTPVVRLEIPNLPLRAKYAVVQVTERTPEGEYRYEEVKDQLRNQLGERLMIRRYLDRLRLATYVEVREP